MSIETMSDFFTSRVEGYDEHMLNSDFGCKEGYVKMAELIPNNAKTLLDLGCGTGLELDEIFKTKPYIEITGIDLTKAMLDKCKQKHPDKCLQLIHASYFDYNFGNELYDVVISFETLHHFPRDDKVNLYKKIYKALKNNSLYIECDYMVTDQSEEDFYYAENQRIRKEMGIPDGVFYHYDTPCTVENQLGMFHKAGFQKAKKIWRLYNTTILTAWKQNTP